MGKKIALVQCAASAASTAGVFLGHGPSSKVSTTSPGRRKSWLLKCSKPKPGPPVVSISTTRAMPSALGLPAQALVTGAAAAGGGGRAATGGTGVAGTAGVAAGTGGCAAGDASTLRVGGAGTSVTTAAAAGGASVLGSGA